MVFSSCTFLFYFLPIFLIAYILPKKQSSRNKILLCFSLIFYAWGEPIYVILMIFSIFVNWKIAKTIDTIHDHNDKNIRKAHLIIAISFNLCLLIFFKYISFIVIIVEQYVGETLPYAIILKKIPLPIGISFYSFQAISYVIDVYRKRVPHESNLFDMGAYISMFPQLIAGPIVRYEQIKKELQIGRAHV